MVSSALSSSREIGELLRGYRERAGLSQLHLALSAGLSSRHLSYVETGKARPSEMTIARIAGSLELSDEDHNLLRTNAGYRLKVKARQRPAIDIPAVRDALSAVLAEDRNAPVLIKDANWDVAAYNKAADDFLYQVCGYRFSSQDVPLNMLDLVFSREFLRPAIENWQDVARMLMAQVHYEIGYSAGSEEFVETVRTAARHEDFTALWDQWPEQPPEPVTRYRIRSADGRVTIFDAVLTSLGAPHEAVFNGIRIYTFHAR